MNIYQSERDVRLANAISEIAFSHSVEIYTRRLQLSGLKPSHIEDNFVLSSLYIYIHEHFNTHISLCCKSKQNYKPLNSSTKHVGVFSSIFSYCKNIVGHVDNKKRLIGIKFHCYFRFIAADRTGQLFVGDAIITVSYSICTPEFSKFQYEFIISKIIPNSVTELNENKHC